MMDFSVGQHCALLLFIPILFIAFQDEMSVIGPIFCYIFPQSATYRIFFFFIMHVVALEQRIVRKIQYSKNSHELYLVSRTTVKMNSVCSIKLKWSQLYLVAYIK